LWILRNGLMRYPGIYCLIKGSTSGSQPKAHVKVNVCNTILLIPLITLDSPLMFLFHMQIYTIFTYYALFSVKKRINSS